MKNQKHNQEAFELLKVWYFLKTNDILWPSAISALEDRINDLLENDEWKASNGTEEPGIS